MANVTFTVCITEEDGAYWAQIEELPGCFASGFTLDELKEAVVEAIQLYLPEGINLGDAQWGPIEEVPPGTATKGSGSGKGHRKSPPHRRALIHA